MANKIHNRQELLIEKERQRMRLKSIEVQLADDIDNMGDSLKPVNILRSIVNEVKEPGFISSMLGSGISIGADLLIENYVFKNSFIFKGLRTLFERLFTKKGEENESAEQKK